MFDLLMMNSAQVTLGIVFGGVAFILAIENFVPFRQVSEGVLGRWINNLGLTLVDYILLLLVAPSLALFIAGLLGNPTVGLLGRLGLGTWEGFLVCLLTLELLGYWLHRAFHAIPWLWRIHAVHHSDVEVDATTAHRHHPLELLINTVITIPILILLGAEPIVLFVYNALRLTVAAITHGNISFPAPVEKALHGLLVTPDFHRMHHSSERRYTDSNYSGILPVFDFLFRTATRMNRDEQRDMTLGLNEFRAAADARVDRLLAMPFSKVFGARAKA
jgi:sterol desaturase/sphingolipid hydroxylase (fatty acid hydroxylase superfamily)